ncbi:MAG TPA: EAL domain-containing protein [Actinoplanes sp.]|nr:EAL domain-containing protein [Actinoplanes sp.]
MRSAAPSANGRWQWQTFAGAALAAGAVYVADVSTAATVAAFAIVGFASVAALILGPRLHRVPNRTAWSVIATAGTLLLVGALVRPALVDTAGWVRLAGDAFTLPGYLCLLYGVGLLLRDRGGLERHAVIDGLLVCLGAGLGTVLLLTMPAASIPGRGVLVSVLAGLYPLLDVALLLLLVNMAFTTAVWRPAFIALMGSGVFLITGDLAYAIIALDGQIYTSPLLDVPYLLAYTALGVTALHPSAAELGVATRRPVQAWSWPRLALIVPALAVPFVLLTLIGGDSAEVRTGLVVVGALMTALLVARGISAVRAQVAAQLRAEHQSRHDPLTGLPNRRMISDEIERLLGTVGPGGSEQVWVFFLDLDNFKFVNDSWGHDTGDQLVIEIAARLRHAAAGAAMLARVGGDEFLLTGVGDRAGADRMTEAIISCFTDPVPVRDTEVVISASIGVAHAAGGDAPAVIAEALMRDADTAMYRSKDEGPGRSTVFDTSMHDQVRERIELEVALRTALAKGQLHVHYQPIVDLDSGSPLGAEVLVRWDHPERGAIPPTVFIPVAEEAGLITAIGNYVRQAALQQLAEWRANGTVTDEFWMSINVSPRQLRDPDLPAVVADELMHLQIPPRLVVLEITESVMVDSSTLTDQILLELRELGVRLVVDDFGTGFSALGYLRRFPVTGVKIDRSFISGLGTDSGDEEIVRAVVAMSTALGLSIVAEGVETARQRDSLAAIGVVLGQGWLWGRAVAPEHFAARWSVAAPAAAHEPADAPAATSPSTASVSAPSRTAQVSTGDS